MSGIDGIYRQDRYWFDNDKLQKGGVSIYTRNNVKVTNITKSERSECISVICNIELLPSHKMLMYAQAAKTYCS